MDEVIWLWAQTLVRTWERAAQTEGHPSLKDLLLCQFIVWFASSEGNWYQMKCFYFGDLTVWLFCICCLKKLFIFLNTFSRLCFWFLSCLCLLLVFLQINELNRRVSAIENLLNHLEQNVISTYDQVNPSKHTTQLPINHPHHLHHHIIIKPQPGCCTKNILKSCQEHVQIQRGKDGKTETNTLMMDGRATNIQFS